MLIDYKCENKECEKYGEIEERLVMNSEVDSQCCYECGEPLERVWNSNISIKTSDGYKQ